MFANVAINSPSNVGTSILGSLTEREPEAAVGVAVATGSEGSVAELRNKSFLTFTDISKVLSSCFCVLLTRGSEVSAGDRQYLVPEFREFPLEISYVFLIQVDEVNITTVVLEVP